MVFQERYDELKVQSLSIGQLREGIIDKHKTRFQGMFLQLFPHTNYDQVIALKDGLSMIQMRGKR